MVVATLIEFATRTVGSGTTGTVGRRGGVQLHSSAKGSRGPAGCGSCVRFGGGNTGRKSIRKFAERQSRDQQKKHRDVRGVGNFDGRVGAICYALDDSWKYTGVLQCSGVLNARRAALVLRLEHLFHEASSGGPAGKLFRLFSRAGVGPYSGFVGRLHLGNWYGVQPGGCEFYRRSHLICHWSVRADGGGAVGCTGLEGISRRTAAGLCLSGIDVCVLFFVHFGHFLREYGELIHFLHADPHSRYCLGFGCSDAKNTD